MGAGTGSQSRDTESRSEPRWEGWRTELCWLGHWQLTGPGRGRREGGESQGAMSEHAEKAERGREQEPKTAPEERHLLGGSKCPNCTLG